MIWRLPHPIRGLVAFFLVVMVGSMFFGFGLGLPELVGLVLLAVGAFVVASTRTSAEADASS